MEVRLSVLFQLKHRNSIEKWSSISDVSPVQTENSFSPLNSSASYDFSTASAKAFGSNQIQVDNSPVLKFALYGGDIDQDGFIDLTDLNTVFNDASSFVTGYVNTDVNGDNSADLTDLVITFNNSSAFVSKIVP